MQSAFSSLLCLVVIIAFAAPGAIFTLSRRGEPITLLTVFGVLGRFMVWIVAEVIISMVLELIFGKNFRRRF